MDQIYRVAANALGMPADDGEAVGFKESIPHWPAFPDSVEALRRLGGRYKLITCVGRGAMGEVWQGLHLTLNTQIALKLVDASAHKDREEILERFRFEGQASVFWAEAGPCYRCLYPAPPPPGLVPSCAEGGVLGILPGAIGVVQATETVKLILGIGEPLVGRLMLYDALGMSFREMKLRKDPNCPICGENPTVTELIDYEEFCGTPQANAAEEKNGVPEITVQELKRKMDSGGGLNVLDVREPHEYEVANIGAKLVPLGELPQRLAELGRDENFAIHCKTGGRSAKAVKLLHDAGFQHVYNVKGGITAWSEEIDPSVPKY